MFSSAMDISTSGLVAQRTRLNAISSNIANISTTHNELGQPAPYQARYAIFKTDDQLTTRDGAMGVKVDSIQIDQETPPVLKFQPGHPDANEKGIVAYPGIDMVTEFVDAMEATRAYEANLGVMEVTKNLAQQTLRILA